MFIFLEISLPHAQLDPIDVAFYDPHLRKNSQRLYLSSSVLLGALVQLHRLHKESCVIAFVQISLLTSSQEIARLHQRGAQRHADLYAHPALRHPSRSTSGAGPEGGTTQCGTSPICIR